jgi:hypothetical protein
MTIKEIQEAMSTEVTYGWNDMVSAPRPRGEWDSSTIKIDILAKIWIKDTDKFEFARFPDCRWRGADTMGQWKAGWVGVDEGWLPVAWRPVPTIPKDWPVK